MEDSDDGWIAASKNADNAAKLAAVGARGQQLDEHLVALHGGVDLVGRDEDVFADGSAGLTAVRPDETVTVAMQVEASGSEVVAGEVLAVLAQRPVVAIELGEMTRGGQPGELLD